MPQVADSPSLGFEDAFSGYGVQIDQYHDANGADTVENLRYVFSDLELLAIAEAFADDGLVGFGFDPDCHFYNSGITLTIQFAYTAGNDNKSWGQIKNRFKHEE